MKEITVGNLIEILQCEIVNEGDLCAKIEGFYCGDFLSHVMSGLKKNECWFTIMNNHNVVAVASLAEASVVVLCENVLPMSSLIEKAKAENLTIIKTKLSIFQAVKKVAQLDI